MTLDLFLAFLAFAFVGTATPGPNNLMILASGANFGLRRSVPHVLGIGVGFAVMLMAVGLGIAGLFELVPVLRPFLAAVSVAYLLWLAWRIAQAQPMETGRAAGRPLTFLQAAAFQWVNPKAWTMALGAVTLYASGSVLGVGIIAVTFWAVSIPVLAVWAGLGVQVTRLLATPGHVMWFNRAMALALVASLWPTISPLLSS